MQRRSLSGRAWYLSTCVSAAGERDRTGWCAVGDIDEELIGQEGGLDEEAWKGASEENGQANWTSWAGRQVCIF
jgi:hypothetical protein